MDDPTRPLNVPVLEESAGYDRATMAYIQHAAAHGLYEHHPIKLLIEGPELSLKGSCRKK